MYAWRGEFDFIVSAFLSNKMKIFQGLLNSLCYEQKFVYRNRLPLSSLKFFYEGKCIGGVLLSTALDYDTYLVQYIILKNCGKFKQ